MGLITLIFLSVGLAMDAFAVSITEGIAVKRLRIKHTIIVGGVFGFFQALMPLVGYASGQMLYSYISKYSHFVTFILLLIIGGKMIYEAYVEQECERTGSCEFNTNLILLAIATSIDALAIGFSLAMIKPENIWFVIFVIGIITFVICASGVYIGNKIGKMFNTKAELFGGIILIIIGLKTLIEGLL